MPDKNKFTMIPIKRTDVFQTIIQHITNFLDSKQIKPGERLPSERELASMLNVSRTSVRQALKVLESSGRIETRVGSGTFLAEPPTVSLSDTHSLERLIEGGVTKEFLRNLIVARTSIERAIFEDYAWRANKSGINQLRELIELNREKFSSQNCDDDDSALDLSFEKKVAQLGGNPILINMQEQLHHLWVLAWRQYGFTPEQTEVLHEEHLAIMDALAAKNSARVADLIVQHVDKEID
ncbi:TPA: FadR family transcriptional regulator [Citrobacter farmeri]|uniref:FadR family transcriptional regulator n=1 Tax=Citrobacter farmeri TaxID=67824 RepID=A0A8H9TVE0_9ENTR|nr:MULTISPECIES: GntR family transcriptional regulator [Enterobacteriaceae]HAT2167623.1 FadR family transcriptional regulator [Citrobacter freundii]EMB4691548.1 FadR family transcriptional regulator [Citrobacter farmeri]MCP1691837.1 GntR family transcriptional repressor for pyruvate dehydrogenase complex [Citrobacter farmeri]MCW2421895.1 GntR family transcriptional repressor for pyruvate dehydrogenase complex [Citrobacter farmeri]NTY11239.1 FadR family transcriptional regulator [Citrobacter fa